MGDKEGPISQKNLLFLLRHKFFLQTDFTSASEPIKQTFCITSENFSFTSSNLTEEVCSDEDAQNWCRRT